MAKKPVKRVGVSKRSHVSEAMVGQLRAAFDRSERTTPFTNRADVVAHFGSPPVGSIEDELFRQLKQLLPASTPTGCDTHDLRDIARALALEAAITGLGNHRDRAVLTLLQAFSAGTQLKKPDKAAWNQAVTLTRALVALNAFCLPDFRHLAVAEAAKRLVARGYTVSVKHTRPWMSHKDMKRYQASLITTDV
jgi:hypothetical protein